VEAFVGDIVEITVNNKLVNESTGIHWHGLHQIGTTHMDGPAHVTQCPIAPGSSFTYKFYLDQSGTYWYHSHTGSQYPDGLRGSFIVKDKVDPFKTAYDEEYLLTVSDWYNQQVPDLLANTVFNKTNVQLRPPLPQGGLINDGTGATYKIEKGKKYKFRIINISAFTGCFLTFEDHPFSIIEIDGVYVTPSEAKLLFITPAQRYSVIIEAKEDDVKNFGISAIFDVNPNFRAPVIPFNINATGTLEYDAALGAAPQYKIANFDDRAIDTDLLPIVPKVLGATDVKLELNFNLGVDATGVPRAFVNDLPYVHQKVPTLYTALTTGQDALNATVYGQVNPFIVKKGQVVELVVNNLHFAHHPFHFHGHHFQICERAAPGAGVASDSVVCKDGVAERDVVTIEGGSHAILRFKADNPGVWIFHCHIEWHVPLGLTATIIEDPIEIQKTIKIPQGHLDACKANCYPTKGNAGGNTVDHFDLSDAAVPAENDPGAIFTFEECSADEPVSSSSVGPTSTQYTTSTLYSTKTYTVTSCAPTVTKCHSNGTHVTTEVVPYTTTVCPVTLTSVSKTSVTKAPKPTKAYTYKPAPPLPDNTAPWPDFYQPSTYLKTTTYTVTTAGTAVIKTDTVKATSAIPIVDVYPTHTAGPVGTGKATPTTTGKGLTVTAGAGKAAGGFGAAAFAGVLAAALL